MEQKQVLIVGGGFGGIRVALDLARTHFRLPDIKITLISDKPHFEYHAALYRVVTGKSPLEVCIPLKEIFSHTKVEIIQEKITAIDIKKKIATAESGKHYLADFLILALGSETVYFNIPGLAKRSFGFKSIAEAMALKHHIHEVLETGQDRTMEQKVSQAHFVVIGGGASGTELAAELAAYTKNMAFKHKLDPSLITIDLIEAGPRLVANLPIGLSETLFHRLHRLGINIYLNRAIMKEDLESVQLKDMEMKTQTVIWTAGVKPNYLYSQTYGLIFDKKGRVMVDHFLQPEGHKDIFIIGDGAATPYSGMAQTAIHDAAYVANSITKKLTHQRRKLYAPIQPAYAIPAGPGWAAVVIGSIYLFGKTGWFIRRFIDFKFFLSILPLDKAWMAFRSGKRISETCPVCSKNE